MRCNCGKMSHWAPKDSGEAQTVFLLWVELEAVEVLLLGGTNSLLAVEQAYCIPLIQDTPTMLLGMDISHGSPGQSDIPSIVPQMFGSSSTITCLSHALLRKETSQANGVLALRSEHVWRVNSKMARLLGEGYVLYLIIMKSLK